MVVHESDSMEIKRVEEQLHDRINRFEGEVRGEIRQIKDTLAAQAVTQGRNETILATLVDEVKSFRTDFMGLLTASMKAQQRQNQGWHDVAVKVILAFAGAGGVLWAVTKIGH